jgi:hypothetical protein
MHRNWSAFTAFLTIAFVVAIGTGPLGCQSKEAGVTTSLRSQWTTVKADTKKTTEAAKAVLEGEGLKDVKAESTMYDGTAQGKKADGTEIKVSVKKTSDNYSEVTATVGAMGDQSIGADIVKKIKDRVEGK